MATMNISLPDELKAWVEKQAQSGHYANSSDYVRDLIRKDEQIAWKKERLLALAKEGLESGISEYSAEEVWQRAKAKMRDISSH